ncbi:MAG TPA: NlpC/P60 family protein [Streptosporangiaceae bacterium]|nr:NlpC/P60 family protein [Streptosporangiaceae bacterium]
MERLPRGRHHRFARITIVTGACALVSLILPAGVAGAASASTASPPPASLQAKLAQIKSLSEQVDHMGQQYDSLRIQLQQAQKEEDVARLTAKRDQKLLASGRAQIGQIAAAGYMNGSMSPDLQLLQDNDPQVLLNQASIMAQLEKENGEKVSQVTSAQTAANEALLAASQEAATASKLTAAMAKKVAQIQAKENVLNSSVYSQALNIFQQTGNYPTLPVVGNSIGAQALRFALAKLGDEYVWGAAGPSTFDCSGLVMWAYEHVGISLAHFTGDQWNEGQHIPMSELQPGDLIFMYGLDHVGMYVGNGMMVDAPSTGQVVQIQPIPMGAVDGAVRIA